MTVFTRWIATIESAYSNGGHPCHYSYMLLADVSHFERSVRTSHHRAAPEIGDIDFSENTVISCSSSGDPEDEIAMCRSLIPFGVYEDQFRACSRSAGFRTVDDNFKINPAFL